MGILFHFNISPSYGGWLIGHPVNESLNTNIIFSERISETSGMHHGSVAALQYSFQSFALRFRFILGLEFLSFSWPFLHLFLYADVPQIFLILFTNLFRSSAHLIYRTSFNVIVIPSVFCCWMIISTTLGLLLIHLFIFQWLLKNVTILFKTDYLMSKSFLLPNKSTSLNVSSSAYLNIPIFQSVLEIFTETKILKKSCYCFAGWYLKSSLERLLSTYSNWAFLKTPHHDNQFIDQHFNYIYSLIWIKFKKCIFRLILSII